MLCNPNPVKKVIYIVTYMGNLLKSKLPIVSCTTTNACDCQESPLRQSGTYIAPGRGAWAETTGRGLESKGQVVRWRGDDSSDAKPHAQHVGRAGLSGRQDWGPS